MEHAFICYYNVLVVWSRMAQQWMSISIFQNIKRIVANSDYIKSGFIWSLLVFNKTKISFIETKTASVKEEDYLHPKFDLKINLVIFVEKLDMKKNVSEYMKFALLFHFHNRYMEKRKMWLMKYFEITKGID